MKKAICTLLICFAALSVVSVGTVDFIEGEHAFLSAATTIQRITEPVVNLIIPQRSVEGEPFPIEFFDEHGNSYIITIQKATPEYRVMMEIEDIHYDDIGYDANKTGYLFRVNQSTNDIFKVGDYISWREPTNETIKIYISRYRWIIGIPFRVPATYKKYYVTHRR